MSNVGTGQRGRSRERWRYDSFLNYTSQAWLIRICHSIKQEKSHDMKGNTKPRSSIGFPSDIRKTFPFLI